MSIYSQISQNKVKTYLIMSLFTIIFTGFFYIIGKYFGGGSGSFYALLGFLISFVSSVYSYYNSDKLVLSTTHARPATKEEFFDFYTVTENLSIASGTPMPKLYVIDDPSPNAFATGRNPQHGVVCATTGLLHIMDRAELEGVIAHELSHIKNYDILVSTVTAVLVGTIALAADWIMRSLWWGGGSDDDRPRNPIMLVLLIAALIITPIVATLIQLAVSRRREFLADASGALLTRYPDGLASALEKIAAYPRGVSTATTSTAHLFISNPFKQRKVMSWMTNLFSTHPPVEQRVAILRKM
ncbi:M48 family metallopeptidase [Candidatus Woesebacteria bacterium]|nr:M48 family metallopeptidase [Candidatus Woesebacteria bacterium]